MAIHPLYYTISWFKTKPHYEYVDRMAAKERLSTKVRLETRTRPIPKWGWSIFPKDPLISPPYNYLFPDNAAQQLKYWGRKNNTSQLELLSSQIFLIQLIYSLNVTYKNTCLWPYLKWQTWNKTLVPQPRWYSHQNRTTIINIFPTSFNNPNRWKVSSMVPKKTHNNNKHRLAPPSHTDLPSPSLEFEDIDLSQTHWVPAHLANIKALPLNYISPNILRSFEGAGMWKYLNEYILYAF